MDSTNFVNFAFSFVVQICMTYLMVTLVFKAHLKKQPKSWTEANSLLEKQEIRLETLLKRDFDTQERIWALMDENKALKGKIVELQRSLQSMVDLKAKADATKQKAG